MTLVARGVSEELRRALVRGLSKVAVERASRYVHALGNVGGAGSQRALERHLARIEEASGPTDPAPPGLLRTCEAILRTNKDHAKAARLLADRLEQGERPQQLRAAVYITAVFESLPTAAMETLASALRELAVGDDDELFAKALSAVSLVDPERSRYRAETAYRGAKSADEKEGIIERWSRCPLVVSQGLVPLYHQEVDLRLRLRILRRIGCAVPEARVMKDVRSALEEASPSVRLLALRVLESTPEREWRSRLLKRALVDESDPWLRRMISRLMEAS